MCKNLIIVENSSRLGLLIPEKLKNALAQLHNKGGNES
ncbi:MAG TPA: phage holin family protein [Bacillota bacterium]|nr:phage holin family protein [Bacillota bacterium]